MKVKVKHGVEFREIVADNFVPGRHVRLIDKSKKTINTPEPTPSTPSPGKPAGANKDTDKPETKKAGKGSRE